MNRTQLVFLCSAILVASVGIYIYLSSADQVVVNEAGAVEGALNNARAALQGRRFWEDQLQQARMEMDRKISQPAMLEKYKASLAKAKQIAGASMEALYAKHPEIRPPKPEVDAGALRELADEVEQAEFLRLVEMDRVKRIASLQKILIAIQVHSDSHQ